MKYLLSIVLTLMITVSSAPAQSVPSFSMVLMGLCSQKISAAGIPITGISCAQGQIPSASSITVNFLPSATTDQQTLANQIVATFPWAMNPPNVLGFILAINQDPLSTANNGALVLQMGSLLSVFSTDMQYNNYEALQQHWKNAIMNYGAPSPNQPSGGVLGNWLTTQVQTMIETYANEYDIPLIAQ